MIFLVDLKSGSHRPKNVFIYVNKSPLKMMKNVFLFHVKSSLHSGYNYIFVLTFWLSRKMV